MGLTYFKIYGCFIVFRYANGAIVYLHPISLTVASCPRQVLRCKVLLTFIQTIHVFEQRSGFHALVSSIHYQYSITGAAWAVSS